jgi:hypothetical protein
VSGETKIGCSYAKLCTSVEKDSVILVSDGTLSIQVKEILSEKELVGICLNNKCAPLCCTSALRLCTPSSPVSLLRVREEWLPCAQYRNEQQEREREREREREGEREGERETQRDTECECVCCCMLDIS